MLVPLGRVAFAQFGITCPYWRTFQEARLSAHPLCSRLVTVTVDPCTTFRLLPGISLWALSILYVLSDLSVRFTFYFCLLLPFTRTFLTSCRLPVRVLFINRSNGTICKVIKYKQTQRPTDVMMNVYEAKIDSRDLKMS